MLNSIGLMAQSNPSAGIVEIIFILIMLGLAVILIAGMWKVFEKANQPGWGVLIPVYNVVLMLKIAGKPLWWIVLFFIPLVNYVIIVLVSLAIARNFGKGTGFGIGLAFLPYVFYPLLGFSNAEYNPVDTSSGGGFNPMRSFDRPAGGMNEPG